MDVFRATAEQIADLIKVPSDRRRSEFVLGLRDLIAEMNARSRAMAVGGKHADEIKAARTKLLAARDALRPLCEFVDTAPIGQLVEWLSILVGENPDPATTAGKRGRREGSVSAWPFQLLVYELLHMSTASGGSELTLSDNAGDAQGTLVEVLHLLRPHISFIPRHLSYSRLEPLHANRLHARTSRTALATLRRLFPPPPFTLLRQ